LRALRRSPQVSVLTNITPNHLDRHGTMQAYAAAKGAILEFQRAEDACVLNMDDPRVRALPRVSRVFGFSLKGPQSPGAWAGDPLKTLSVGDQTASYSIDVSRRRLPGRFNVQNMLAAAAAGYAVAGHRPTEWVRACEEVFASFGGVEHRLEFVAEVRGACYYNDSIATNPDSTIAALDALPGPFVVILGGYDKQLPFEGLARKIEERDVRCVVLLGQAAGKIRDALATLRRPPSMEVVGTLRDAVNVCASRARPRDQVLLSPACASFDQFRNFVERGRLFKELVAGLAA
jgi:UDP-N-acetylmuramoylalanine--D-glutamate ligase